MTLESALRRLPTSVGFNVEVKHPKFDEVQGSRSPPQHACAPIIVLSCVHFGRLGCLLCMRQMIAKRLSPPDRNLLVEQTMNLVL